MARIVRMNISPGMDVSVLVPDSVEPAAFDVAATTRIENGLRDALDFVASFAHKAAERLETLQRDIGPEEVALEFGIVIGAQAGIVLTSGSMEGQFKVTLTWKRGK